MAELLAAHPGAWCPDQYHNPDNVTAYEPMALELVAQLGRVDVLVTSVGTVALALLLRAGHLPDTTEPEPRRKVLTR